MARSSCAVAVVPMPAIHRARVCCGSPPSRVCCSGSGPLWPGRFFPMPCKESRRAFLHDGGCGLLTLAAMGLVGDVVLPVSAIAAAGAGKDKTYQIPTSDSVNVDRGNSLVVVRYQNHVYAFTLACPH